MTDQQGRIAIVGGMRTPFVKAGAQFADLSQLDLSAHAVEGILKRFELDPKTIDLLVWGRVLHDPLRCARSVRTQTSEARAT